MTEQDVIRRLSEISESDAEGLQRLAEEIGAYCRAPARTVLAEWTGGPPDRQPLCAFVCSDLKELAVAEMMRQADAVTPAQRVQLMEMVATRQLAFRELMLTALEPLLRDVTPAGIPGIAGEMRTCDAAYHLVRKIVTPEGPEGSQFSSENEFLALDADARTDEIRRWMRSNTWCAIFPEE